MTSIVSKRHCLSLAFVVVASTLLPAADVEVIQSGQEPEISGKEVDWIYGDYWMRNGEISMVIAAPLATRDANMTVRNIGGSILDLTLKDPSNDQLSAYIPTGGRYLFHDPAGVEIGRDGEAVYWQCRSSRSLADDGTTATVRYRLAEGNAFVETTLTIEGDAAAKVRPFDTVRADGTFSLDASDGTAYCTDSFFRQTIGFKVPGNRNPPRWRKGRPHQLRYLQEHVERSERRLQWTLRVYPATSPGDLISVAETEDSPAAMYIFDVAPDSVRVEGVDSAQRAKVVLTTAGDDSSAEKKSITLQTDDQGLAHARLQPGRYVAVASAIGYENVEREFTASAEGGELKLPLADASGFEAEVKDDQGDFIPVKATVYSVGKENPKFGPSSTRTFVENCVYSVHGRLRCPLDPGTYEIYFSHGPEFDRVKTRLEIAAKTMTKVSVTLDRVVNSAGWVSAEMHSHSSPSGDNTSDQFGRVENLLCEHLEFAPCTEHARVSSYSPHLEQMELTHLLATCTGIEVTGSPLPVNHQNSFPLHHHPHTQNGGGPNASSNPVVQIERLAMWDESSDKLVQMNHPNLHQIYGDRDVDGTPDKGFRQMLQWTDVVEVHPLSTIFEDVAANPPEVRKMRIPIFQWMQLLNQGRRIPGVINTDAHYNHHGSGWRRNWIASSTDDPAEISTDEMVRQAEQGHIIMSTGPYLSVSALSANGGDTAIPGDDLLAPEGTVTLQVSVQCPNWLDVNRVQVFVNGRPSAKHNYTRRNSPQMFSALDAVTKFDSALVLSLDQDAHVIVATIGEGLTMEKVMGRRYGNRPPIAVSNPIFVDVDGNGFQHNGDELGLPLPRVER